MTVVDLPLHMRTTAYVVRCRDGSKCHEGTFRTRARANHWCLQVDALCTKGPHTVRPVAPVRDER